MRINRQRDCFQIHESPTISLYFYFTFLIKPLQGQVGAVIQLVEYRTRNQEVPNLRVRLTPGPLQATLSKL